VLHAGVTAALQHREVAREVGVGVGEGLLQGVADPRLGGQVDHLIESFGLEQRGHGSPVCQVQAQEAEA